MANVSDMSQSEIQARIDAGDRAQAKLDKQKSDASELGQKVATVAGAALAGGAYGLLNRRQGGNFYQPWSLAGRVPLDIAVGLGGAALILLGKTEEGFVNGAAAGLVAVASARYGDDYQAGLMGGAPPQGQFAPGQMGGQVGGPMNWRHAHMTGGANRFGKSRRSQPSYSHR